MVDLEAGFDGARRQSVKETAGVTADVRGSDVGRSPRTIEIVLASGTRVLVPVNIEQVVLERLFNAIERRR
jgi:hypothetical protein